eukprot:14871887-Alexandrium_andersonii.AAC.1
MASVATSTPAAQRTRTHTALDHFGEDVGRQSFWVAPKLKRFKAFQPVAEMAFAAQHIVETPKHA